MVRRRAAGKGFYVLLALTLVSPALAAEETLPKMGSAAPAFDATLRLPTDRPHGLAKGPMKKTPLYAATAAGLFVSADGGGQWQHLLLPKATGDEVFAVAVHPLNESVVYIGGRTGLWKSQDGGATWSPLPGVLPGGAIPRSLAIAAGAPEVSYVGTDLNGIFRSDDGGTTWISRSEGLPEALAGGRPAPIRSLAVDPTNPSVAYAGAELHGFYKSTDGGASWGAINRGLGLFPLQRRVGGPGLLINHADPRQMIATLIRPIHSRLVKTSIYQSSDGGEHWFPLEVDLPPGAEGVALAEDPSDPQGVVLFTIKGAIRIQWRPIAGVAESAAQP